MKETTLWILHIAAGVVILVLLAIHMGIMHLDAVLYALGIGAKNPIAVDSVFPRSQNTFFMVTYILLLGAALYHGLYGFRTVLFELNPARPVKTMITWGFALAGLILFAYGTYAAIYVFMAKEISG